MSDRAITELAYGLRNSDMWEDLIDPMIEESKSNTLDTAITSPNMEELSRCQGWVACLDWLKLEIETLAGEYEQENPDER